MNTINNDIIRNIVSFNNGYVDIESLRYVNKFYYKFINEYVDSIIYIEDIYDIEEGNEYDKFIKVNECNTVIISDIYQVLKFNPKNILYLHLQFYQRYCKFNDEFLFFTEDKLEFYTNLVYLDIKGMMLSYIPKTLNKIKYLNISDNYITRIPKELTELIVLISASEFSDGLQIIPQSILDNIECLECTDYLRHDIIVDCKTIRRLSVNIHVGENEYTKKIKIFVKNKNGILDEISTDYDVSNITIIR